MLMPRLVSVLNFYSPAMVEIIPQSKSSSGKPICSVFVSAWAPKEEPEFFRNSAIVARTAP